MRRNQTGVSTKILTCVLLVIFANVVLADFCPAGFTYNFAYNVCTHPIIGNPSSAIDYCQAIEAGSQVKFIFGVQMCTPGEDCPDGWTHNGQDCEISVPSGDGAEDLCTLFGAIYQDNGDGGKCVKQDASSIDNDGGGGMGAGGLPPPSNGK